MTLLKTPLPSNEVGMPRRLLHHALLQAHLARLLVRVVSLCAVFACAPAFAQEDPGFGALAVRHFAVADGLPHHSVPTMLQTRDGYMWFGSESGLARFDGAQFVIFRLSTTPELKSNLIRYLFEDASGWLWIGTQGGLCRYRDGRFYHTDYTGQRVVGISQDRSGRIWIASQMDGLAEYTGDRFISHVADADMPADKDVRCLYIDSSDRLWLVFRTSGAFIRENGVMKPFAPSGYQFGDRSKIMESPKGVFWISHSKGLLRIEGGKTRNYGPDQGLPDALTSIGTDRNGRLWAITNTLHFYVPEKDQFTRIPVPGVENCRGFLEDSEGNLWVGSSGDGVVRMRPSAYSMLTASNVQLDESARTVALDRAGKLWVGIGAKVVAKRDGSEEANILDPDVGEVWSICPLADGSVWIGTRNALCRWDGTTLKTFPEYQRVRALYEDRAGTLWIGAETEGVTYYRDGRFTSIVADITAKQKKPYRPVAMVFAEGPDGTFYIGLREMGGLVEIRNGILTSDQTLPSNDLRAIYPDREGSLWVGTKGVGLTVRHDGRWFSSEEWSTPLNDQVAAVAEDAQGRLWLGTPEGIVSTSKEQLLEMVHGERAKAVYRRVTEGDGVTSGTIGFGSSPDIAQAADGRIWFASRHGVASVNPARITTNRAVPPVHIERVLIDNRGSIVTPGKPIQLPPGTRSLEIEYTGVSFVASGQMRFRYRLSGRDEDWIDAGTRRVALYADLPPGSFRFHVIACNADGVWNDTGDVLGIEQLPFFYQTNAFVGLVAVGLLGTALGVYRWRTAALRRRNRELQRKIAESTTELAKSYEAIRASEVFYHSLVESLPQIIVRKDVDGRITYANTGFAELVQRPLGEVIGRTDEDLFPAEAAQKYRRNDQRVRETRQQIEYEEIIERGDRRRYLHVKVVPLHNPAGRDLGVQILFWDLTSFREIEEKLNRAQRDLLETSRLAGIAEMATGILHNLGNALNSVNTAANLTSSRIRASKIVSVSRVAELLAQQHGNLPEFFANDHRGRRLPAYLQTLGQHLLAERDEILRELDSLQENLDHIKGLVATQQQYAHVSRITEVLSATELVEVAARLNESSMGRAGATLVREFTPAPPVRVERQKAVQILDNLLKNARDSVLESGCESPKISVGVHVSPEGRPQIHVADNGLGIAGENLTRIFGFGFTTKKNGHGFGLHWSAVAAGELGGSLTAQSEGLGKGATFILELPPATQTDTKSAGNRETEDAPA